MAQDPFVSVIIPAYNGADALRRAAVSILQQTYRNFELIIVDDSSTEPLEPVARSLDDSRVVYLRHAQNKGAAAARNTGMRRAGGDLLAFLDSDDEALPGRLEAQVKVFQGLSPDTGLVIANLGSPDGQKTTYVPRDVPSGHVTDKAFPGSVFSPPSSWMLRRGTADQVGPFDEQISTIEDADYFVRVLEQAGIYYLQDVVGIKYLSSERKGYFMPIHFSGNDRFLDKHLERMKKDPAYLSRFYYNKAKDLSRSSRRGEARAYFFKAFCVRPCLGHLVKCFKG